MEDGEGARNADIAVVHRQAGGEGDRAPVRLHQRPRRHGPRRVARRNAPDQPLALLHSKVRGVPPDPGPVRTLLSGAIWFAVVLLYTSTVRTFTTSHAHTHPSRPPTSCFATSSANRMCWKCCWRINDCSAVWWLDVARHSFTRFQRCWMTGPALYKLSRQTITSRLPRRSPRRRPLKKGAKRRSRMMAAPGNGSHQRRRQGLPRHQRRL
mmetsp:Transcript_64285/g.177907  ORF Transcript_64285/g.177907 Transcript_64285/m.177907 type:complete len:210 (+) Transcript_64285:206-835(+)